MRPAALIFLIYSLSFTTLSSQELTEVSGVVRDIYTGESLPGAHVTSSGNSRGVISNNEGAFVFRTALLAEGDRMCVSFVGYEVQCLPPDELSENMIIRLKPMSSSVGEVTVRGGTKQVATDILRKAVESIPRNYDIGPVGLKGFYREVTEENRQIVSIGEAAVDIWKSPNNQVEVPDMLKIEKARTISGDKAYAYADFSSIGGPYYRLRDDIIRHRAGFLKPDEFRYYDYKLLREIGDGNEKIYVISFKPVQLHTSASSNISIYRESLKYDNTSLLYEGEVFVRASDYAIVRAVYSIPRDRLNYAAYWFFDKTPPNSRVYLRDGIFEAEYRFRDGKWFLSHTKGTIHFSLSGKALITSINYKVVNELLISERGSGVPERFTESEVERSYSLMSERTGRYDELFWEDFDIVKATGDLLRFGEARTSSVVFSDLLETKLDLHHTMKPYEILFLQTDRNRYNACDTIRFSIWSQEAATGFPSYFSSIVNVSLSTPDGIVADSARFRLHEGRGSGYLTAPGGLADGIYRITAITSGMLNFPDSRVFNQFVRVGRIHTAISEVGAGDEAIIDIEVNMVPEGGNLIAGMESVIVISARSPSGEPVAVTALLRDQKNRVIDTVKTDTLGMGRFRLTPAGESVYHLQVTEPMVRKASQPLPDISPTGITLNYRGTSEDAINLLISSKPARGDKYYLVCTNKGRVVWYDEFMLYGSAIKTINRDRVPGGISTITLFDIAGNKVAERLIYLEKGAALKIDAAAGTLSYGRGERVRVTFVLTDENSNPVPGTMAVSVTDSYRGTDNLLFVPSAVGTMISGYSMIPTTPERFNEVIRMVNGEAADNIMLSGMDKRYDWQSILRSNRYDYPEPADFSVIGVKMTNLRQKAAGNEIIKGTGTYDLRSYTWRSDADGFVYINPASLSPSTHHLLLSHSNHNRRDQRVLKVTGQGYYERFLSDTWLPPFPDVVKLNRRYRADSFIGEDVIDLNEVLVQGVADTAARIAEYNRILGSGFSIERSGRELEGAMSFLELVFRVRVPVWQNGYQLSFDPFPQGFNRQSQTPHPVLFVLDGSPVGKSWEQLQGMTYLDVKRIAYIPFNVAFPLYGADAMGGVILVESHSAGGSGKPLPVGNRWKEPFPLAVSRPDAEFRSPVYRSEPGEELIDSDRRVTLHWDPLLMVDESGFATITFYTGGVPGDKVISVNGTGLDGRPFTGTFHIAVR